MASSSSELSKATSSEKHVQSASLADASVANSELSGDASTETTPISPNVPEQIQRKHGDKTPDADDPGLEQRPEASPANEPTTEHDDQIDTNAADFMETDEINDEQSDYELAEEHEDAEAEAEDFEVTESTCSEWLTALTMSRKDQEGKAMIMPCGDFTDRLFPKHKRDGAKALPPSRMTLANIKLWLNPKWPSYIELAVDFMCHGLEGGVSTYKRKFTWKVRIHHDLDTDIALDGAPGRFRIKRITNADLPEIQASFKAGHPIYSHVRFKCLSRVEIVTKRGNMTLEGIFTADTDDEISKMSKNWLFMRQKAWSIFDCGSEEDITIIAYVTRVDHDEMTNAFRQWATGCDVQKMQNPLNAYYNDKVATIHQYRMQANSESHYTKPERRPRPKLRMTLAARNNSEFITARQNLANTEADLHRLDGLVNETLSHSFLLFQPIASDKSYVGALRLHPDSTLRLTDGEKLDIKFKNLPAGDRTDTWTGFVMQDHIPSLATTDILIDVQRPVIEGVGWSKNTPSCINNGLKGANNKAGRMALEALVKTSFTSANIVTIKLSDDQKSLKALNFSATVMNTDHEIVVKQELKVQAIMRKGRDTTDRDRMINSKAQWKDNHARHALGQDLRVLKTSTLLPNGQHMMDVLKRLDPSATYNEGQQVVFTAMDTMADGQLLIQGPPATGKTKLSIDTILALISTGEKVLVTGPSNPVIDNILTRLITRAKSLDMYTQGDVIRGYTQGISDKVEQLAKEKFMTKEADPYKQPIIPAAPVVNMETQLAMMLRRNRSTVTGVKDPRYVMPEVSAANILLVKSGLIHRERPTEARIIKARKIVVGSGFIETEEFFDELVDEDKAREDKRARAEIINAEKDDRKRQLQKDLAAVSPGQMAAEFQLYAERFRAQESREPSRDEDMQFRDASVAAMARVFREALVVGATPIAAYEKVLSRNFTPSVILIDEAAQLPALMYWLLTTLWPLARIIQVGDPKQIRPQTDDPRMNAWEVFQRHSEFVRQQRLGAKVYFLSMSHRFPKDICNLTNLSYDNQLTTDVQLADRPISSIAQEVFKKYFNVNSYVLMLDVVGSRDGYGLRSSKQNKDQATVGLLVARLLKEAGVKSKDIVFISGYDAQVKLNQKAIRGTKTRMTSEDSTAATIDSYQGRENEVVILELVGTKSLGFLAEPERINVAISRSRSALIIIGSFSTLDRLKKLKNTLIDKVYTMAFERQWIAEVSVDDLKRKFGKGYEGIFTGNNPKLI